MTDPHFLPARGGGGGLWHILPLAVDGSTAFGSTIERSHEGSIEGSAVGEDGTMSRELPWTHVMQLDGAGLRDGVRRWHFEQGSLNRAA
jgi:hypothetical protein